MATPRIAALAVIATFAGLPTCGTGTLAAAAASELSAERPFSIAGATPLPRLGLPSPAVRVGGDAIRPDMVLRCGQVVLELGFGRDVARLRAQANPVLDLPRQPSAAGERFGTADGASWIRRTENGITVQLAGTALPPCQVAPAPLSLPVNARGNEPFWNVSIDPGRMIFTRPGGAGVTAGTPVPQAAGSGWRYAPAGADLVVTLRPGQCRDTMTGMPHPASAEVETGGQVLAGCAGAPRDLLTGPAWTVFEVGGEAVESGITATIAFDAEPPQVHGSSGCNRFAGGYVLSGEGLSFAAPLASTMMACDDPQMALERRFLDALAGVDRFDLAQDGHLVLLGADRPAIRARR